jgi:hypothetical protein
VPSSNQSVHSTEVQLARTAPSLHIHIDLSLSITKHVLRLTQILLLLPMVQTVEKNCIDPIIKFEATLHIPDLTL